MNQLNKMDDDSLLYLRRFKSFQDASEWRYYFENCPYGDLEKLRLRYKAWGQVQRAGDWDIHADLDRTYLPEIFLWHIFKGLILSAATMERGPWGQLDKPRVRLPKWYLLHCDIKPQNGKLKNPLPERI